MEPAAMTRLVDATWPAAEFQALGPWTLRFTTGAGSRVSAASATVPGSCDAADIALAEAAMKKAGQHPLFMLRSGEEALDRALDHLGYRIKDPVTIFAGPAQDLAQTAPPPVTCFEIWPPLACQKDIWAAGGIGTARLAVMDRAQGPKTTILGRTDDTPAGALFVAAHDGTAMVHAVETAARFRRRGLARHMMQAAARWAMGEGCGTLALLVTDANAAANALYASLGLTAAAGYHYRSHPEAT